VFISWSKGTTTLVNIGVRRPRARHAANEVAVHIRLKLHEAARHAANEARRLHYSRRISN